MIFYLTFNDAPSGIFSSQVIDVIKFLRGELKADIKLVAFISLRGFRTNRKKIRQQLKDAIVLPMFPGVHRWKQNYFFLELLCRRLKPTAIIGRSVLATQLALRARKHGKIQRVIYDGRGAIAAEWKEYGVIHDKKMLMNIESLEKSCIQDCDYRVAVSHKLVEHWREQYLYSGTAHSVIPCTLNEAFLKPADPMAASALLKELGFMSTDRIFVYSGSAAGWQSFSLLSEFISPLMGEHAAKLLFLSAPDPAIEQLDQKYPGKIKRVQVSPSQVPAYLSIAHYGMLIRELSITNQVASPVKFAEYLACGLPVIISNNLGDYSGFVKNNNCGFVGTESFDTARRFDRNTLRELALTHFTKKAFTKEYATLVSVGSQNKND